MDADTGRLRIGWYAGVVPRVVFVGLCDDQLAGVAAMSYPDSSSHVVVDHAALVVPEHIHWWLCAFLQ